MMTKIQADRGSIAAGRDVNITITLDGSGQPDVKRLVHELHSKFGIEPDHTHQFIENHVGWLQSIGSFIDASVAQIAIQSRVSSQKYKNLSQNMLLGIYSLSRVKDLSERIETALNYHQYDKAHADIGLLLDEQIVPADAKSELVFDYYLTGYLYLANTGKRTQILPLYDSAFSRFPNLVDTDLLCLLAEMHQEVATRELNDHLLEANLSTLDKLAARPDLSESNAEYVKMLKALCLRRLGERNRLELLVSSVTMHEELLSQSPRRQIEVRNNYAIALIRYYERTREVPSLKKAQVVLENLALGMDEIPISEYQAFPKALNNLGNVSKQFVNISGSLDHLLGALEAYAEAEKYWSEKDAPYEWSMLQKNKAEARLFFMSKNSISESQLAKAIDEITASLKYRTKNEAPWQWDKSTKIREALLALSSET